MIITSFSPFSMRFRLLRSALLRLFVKGMNGVSVYAHEKQSSNICLVIDFSGSLATILKSLKVPLYVGEFLSWYSTRRRTIGGLRRGEVSNSLDAILTRSPFESAKKPTSAPYSGRCRSINPFDMWEKRRGRLTLTPRGSLLLSSHSRTRSTTRNSYPELACAPSNYCRCPVSLTLLRTGFWLPALE